MKNLDCIALMLLLLTCSIFLYGFYENRKMHRELHVRLKTDSKIVSLIGEVTEFNYHDSGGDCGYTYAESVVCNTTFWVFKVKGKNRCIYVSATLLEKFPQYDVESVSVDFNYSYIVGKTLMSYPGRPVLRRCKFER